MAAHAARRLAVMNENLSVILGVEMLCAAQGIEVRAPLITSAPLQDVVQMLRKRVPSLEKDRYMAPDIEMTSQLITAGIVIKSAKLELQL